MDSWVGVDLGAHVDFAAVSVLARFLAVDRHTGLPLRDSRGHPLYNWRIRGMMRFPLRTSYGLISDCIARIASDRSLRPAPRVIVDSTGCGIPTMELIRTALAPFDDVEVWGVSITAGDTWRVVSRYQINCAKTQLTGALRAALLDRLRYLRWPNGERCYGADVLDRELAAFKVKVSRAGNDIQGAESGEHDDMCLCVALPIWAGSLPMMEMGQSPGGADDPDFHVMEQEALALERETPKVDSDYRLRSVAEALRIAVSELARGAKRDE